MSDTRIRVLRFLDSKRNGGSKQREVERQVYYKGRKPALEILGEIGSYNCFDNSQITIDKHRYVWYNLIRRISNLFRVVTSSCQNGTDGMMIL